MSTNDSDAAAVALLPAGERAKEAARIKSDRENERTCGRGQRLETYEEAWKRLGLEGSPNVADIQRLGVVRQKVRA